MNESTHSTPYEPEKPKRSFRLTLTLTSPKPRLDQVLLGELRKQNRNLNLRTLSRNGLKELFKKKWIRIKGQPAVPSSSLARGVTYIDVIGYEES